MYFYKARDWCSKSLLEGNVLLNDKEVKVVSSFKYLGVTLDSTLSFKEHYTTTETKLNSAISKLRSIKRNIPVTLMKTIISCFIRSITDYCIVVWAIHSKCLMDKLQNKVNRLLASFYLPSFNRNKTRRKVKLNYYDLLDRADLLTISERRQIIQVKFVIRHMHSRIFEGWFNPSVLSSTDSTFPRLAVTGAAAAKNIMTRLSGHVFIRIMNL